MKKSYLFLFAVLFSVCLLFGDNASAADVIKMSTTTSTENSGLLDVLLPEFAKDTGIEIKVFAKGTGAAIRDGIDGNVDIIFVHDPEREEKFVADGYGAYRYAVMHNDFVILGPAKDPVGIKGLTAAQAMKKIGNAKATFVSRGDDSGTHAKEQELWASSGTPLRKETIKTVQDGKEITRTFQHPGGLGQWYMSIGQGMGKTLTFTDEKQAYTLTDRGTYLAYKYGRTEGLDLEILCEGDPGLFNPYGILPVNPQKYPHVKFEQADKFAKWLVSEKAQALIAGYKIHGRQAFFPDAISDAGK
ncbi:MAG: substrate-binding domain-containing protein [Deltaproteobacteria bacterium]|nr:substrate-binding domain-containing protein [Deltaproteobacteria bacterium]